MRDGGTDVLKKGGALIQESRPDRVQVCTIRGTDSWRGAGQEVEGTATDTVTNDGIHCQSGGEDERNPPEPITPDQLMGGYTLWEGAMHCMQSGS